MENSFVPLSFRGLLHTCSLRCEAIILLDPAQSLTGFDAAAKVQESDSHALTVSLSLKEIPPINKVTRGSPRGKLEAEPYHVSIACLALPLARNGANVNKLVDAGDMVALGYYLEVF